MPFDKLLKHYELIAKKFETGVVPIVILVKIERKVHVN